MKVIKALTIEFINLPKDLREEFKYSHDVIFGNDRSIKLYTEMDVCNLQSLDTIKTTLIEDWGLEEDQVSSMSEQEVIEVLNSSCDEGWLYRVLKLYPAVGISDVDEVYVDICW